MYIELDNTLVQHDECNPPFLLHISQRCLSTCLQLCRASPWNRATQSLVLEGQVQSLFRIGG